MVGTSRPCACERTVVGMFSEIVIRPLGCDTCRTVGLLFRATSTLGVVIFVVVVVEDPSI